MAAQQQQEQQVPAAAAGGEAFEVGTDVLPAHALWRLQRIWGDFRPGWRLLSGTGGITCFQLSTPQEAPTTGATRKVAVVAHGVGLHMSGAEDPLVAGLLAEGYTVLTYSFYGHGWSYAGPEVLPPPRCCRCKVPNYDRDVFVTQVKELLAFAIPGEVVELWIGHAAGGAVGLWTAIEGAWTIKNMALISPTCCTSKELGQGSLPQCLEYNLPFFHYGVKQQYLKRSQMSFASVDGVERGSCCGSKDGGTYLFQEKHDAFIVEFKRYFELHPQIHEAVAAIGHTFTSEQELAALRAAWKELAQQPSCPTMLLLWGDHDIVEPYTKAGEIASWGARASGPARITLETLQGLGHFSILEDPQRVATAIVDFFGPAEVIVAV